MQEPDCVDIEVFVGVDIAKGDHYACVVTSAGAEVLARSVRNDEAAIGRLIDDAAVHGTVALVIDTTSSAASLLLETAARREVPVAYVTGLAMRRAADLYAGAAKTDPKDAAVLADYARRNADRLTWTTPSDELLVRLRILNGTDADLAADATRAANRLRDALLTVSPALERALGDKLATSGGARDALARWGTPTALRSAGRARIRTRIAKRSPRTAGRLTDAISAALDAQTITVTAEAAWGDTITELAADLDRICARRDHLAADIEAAFMGHPLGKVLNTLCGFGPRTGARTLADRRPPPLRRRQPPRLLRRARPRRLAIRPQRRVPQTPRRQPPPQKRHVHRRLRRHPARPRRTRLLPAQTLTRQTPQRRRDLRRPTPLQHHPRHAQNPNPLPRTPTPTPAPSRLERLDNKTGTPPSCLVSARDRIFWAPSRRCGCRTRISKGMYLRSEVVIRHPVAGPQQGRGIGIAYL